MKTLLLALLSYAVVTAADLVLVDTTGWEKRWPIMYFERGAATGCYTETLGEHDLPTRGGMLVDGDLVVRCDYTSPDGQPICCQTISASILTMCEDKP